MDRVLLLRYLAQTKEHVALSAVPLDLAAQRPVEIERFAEDEGEHAKARR
jgi:hypothetical protein